MNPEILQRLDLLAAKLGVTAAHLWSVLVRQVYLEPIKDAGYLLVVGGIALGFLIAAVKVGKDDQDLGSGLFFASSAAWFIFVLILLGTIGDLAALANPEYAALHEVLKAIAGVK